MQLNQLLIGQLNGPGSNPGNTAEDYQKARATRGPSPAANAPGSPPVSPAAASGTGGGRSGITSQGDPWDPPHLGFPRLQWHDAEFTGWIVRVCFYPRNVFLALRSVVE
jgi:hypothetical protein